LVREKPESFDDHFTQPRMFCVSLTPVERAHVVAAYAFELAKCYESVIRQRVLGVLANIDEDLCAGVAAGLGLQPPEATGPPAPVEASAALSQLGRIWPVQGRTLGIIIGSDPDLAVVTGVRKAALAAGLRPLIIGHRGGVLGKGRSALEVSRTYLTARSVEFDALILCGSVPPAPDVIAAPAAQAPPVSDPRVVLMVGEAFRHAKAIAVLGDSSGVLAEAGCSAGAPGVITDVPAPVAVARLGELLATHRVWERLAPAPNPTATMGAPGKTKTAGNTKAPGNPKKERGAQSFRPGT
jgi:catalase